MLRSREKLPNTACSGRWGFCAFFKHFSTYQHFPFGRRSAARPSATNANRWADGFVSFFTFSLFVDLHSAQKEYNGYGLPH
ncbi:hypothetical protein ANRL3_01508 [Anaerolineae bacterium]|nr:hypothetical protein ANRL3_01508 [Anaerolineae bacterium]